MMTNTYKPHVGGVARSVSRFTDEYRKAGHNVLVVAPTYEGATESTEDVIRIPAIQNFNGSDFSVILPIPKFLNVRLQKFKPDIVHAHHPFLIGSTAVRAAGKYEIPLVFTHHTMYERYTHYVPADSPQMKKFAVELATGYANMCNRVIAPSESIAGVLKKRGVETPIESIPTGVYVDEFREGDGKSFRKKLGIPEQALVIGHLGRLAPEKNLPFLSRAVAGICEKKKDVHFLVIGEGSSKNDIREMFRKKNIENRLHLAGKLKGRELVDGYHAMDFFAFASTSETQGMVLTEAMAAGLPVIALDAPGAREVVKDDINGKLIMNEDRREFMQGLEWMASKLKSDGNEMSREAGKTSEEFSMRKCAGRCLQLYKDAIKEGGKERGEAENIWEKAIEQFRTEWELFKTMADAAVTAIKESEKRDVQSE